MVNYPDYEAIADEHVKIHEILTRKTTRGEIDILMVANHKPSTV